jgi:hypothetical protein
MDNRGISHIFIDNVYAVNMCMSELQTGQQEIFDYVKTSLGDGMVEVELDPKHYEIALQRAINRYRQRSSNAVEESYAFLELKQDQNKYILPDEIINVRELGRRTVGSRSESGQGGTLFEPFNLAYTNTYLVESRCGRWIGNIFCLCFLSGIGGQDVWIIHTVPL